MLTLDTQKIEQHAQRAEKERQRDVNRAWAAQWYATHRVIDDPRGTMLDKTAQLGRPLTTRQFEELLEKLRPGKWHFTWCGDPTKKHLWFKKPDGGLQLVSAYESPIIPEKSFMSGRLENDPPSVFPTDSAPQYPERARKAAMEQIFNDPQEFTEEQVFEIFEKHLGQYADQYKPRAVLIAGDELIRGWRTLLARIVMEGLATPAEIEALVGSMDNAEWKALLGKGGKSHF